MLKRFKRGNGQGESGSKGLFGPIIVRDRLNDNTKKKDSATNQGTDPEDKDESKKQQIEQETSTKEDVSEEGTTYRFHFEPNNKYFTICVYVLAVLAIGIIIIQSIINIPSIVGAFDRFLFVIQPFIVAFFIAFIINPIVKTLAENLFHKALRIKSVKINLICSYHWINNRILYLCNSSDFREYN
jgi:hypothetical protein